MKCVCFQANSKTKQKTWRQLDYKDLKVYLLTSVKSVRSLVFRVFSALSLSWFLFMIDPVNVIAFNCNVTIHFSCSFPILNQLTFYFGRKCSKTESFCKILFHVSWHENYKVFRVNRSIGLRNGFLFELYDVIIFMNLNMSFKFSEPLLFYLYYGKSN